MQIFFNILSTFSVFLLLTLSFYLIYKPTKVFHLSHAFSIVLGGYSIYLFYNLLNFPLSVAIIFALMLAALFGIANEAWFYRPLRSLKDAGLKMLILSLGVYIVFQNLISLFFGDDIKALAKGEVRVGNEFFGAYITDVQIITIVVALLVFALTVLLWHKTQFGKAIRAIAINPELAQVFGIPKNKIIVLSFALGSAYAGLAGLLVGFDTGITPTMGFSLLLYGVVAMIIGGTESLLGLFIGALILALAQNLTAYYIDTKWTDAMTYGILIVFLIIRPYGVSGVKNRQVEV
ncbi:MAG: branched-chain amino acid ABC transporter permease [Urechidicola sp.]|nr:branched-chain amino acid ABC transporter permease [Urechidicola sp.]